MLVLASCVDSCSLLVSVCLSVSVLLFLSLRLLYACSYDFLREQADADADADDNGAEGMETGGEM